MTSLIFHESIKTTEAKAKAIKGSVEKLITKARKQTTDAARQLEKDLPKVAVQKLMSDIGPRFASRNGGYTRIVRLGNRMSDGASMAIIELVEGSKMLKDVTPKKKETKKPKEKDTVKLEKKIAIAKPEKKAVKKATEKKAKKVTK